MDDVEQQLPGGNLGGAVRVGDTVRRPVGPWTPAVHALLDFLAGRLPGVPRVLGFDERGREVLTFLPGRVVPVGLERLTLAQIGALARWTGTLHDAVAGFRHPGPWRMFPVAGATLIGHNDIALYNACFDGEELVGVFDWDLAGPTTELMELAFIAWSVVPLWDADLLTSEAGAAEAAARLSVIAESYGGVDPRAVLRAVPARVRLMIEGIPASAAAGDAGMADLVAQGAPEASRLALASLTPRIPAILSTLDSGR